ncbi:MAG: radical SAM protein [Defluviitaleaceae bacterium]|nr:radical SAM protein [Defluviitaleaceae bacterium]
MNILDKDTQNLEFRQYRIFNKNNDIYLFMIENSSFFKIDKRLLEFLKQEGNTIDIAYKNISHLFTEEEFYTLIENMKNKNFIKTSNNREKEDTSLRDYKPEISSVTLMIAQDCNLRCTYCYGDCGEYFDKGKMSVETALSSIDYLVKNSGRHKTLVVCFLGGEPLMNLPVVKAVVSYCKEKYEDKTFKFTMTTNGTILNADIKKFIKDNDISLQISLDGDKKAHDTNRIYANNTGSYDKIVKNTKDMREDKYLTARATVTKTNLDMVSIFEHLENLNFRNVAISPAQNLLEDSDYPKLIEESTKLLNFFAKLIKDKDFEKASKMHMAWNELGKLHFETKRNFACGAAWNMQAIDINGDVYPCHRYVSLKNYSLGNIEDIEVDTKWFLDEIKLSNHKKCSNCFAKNLCVGACTHENYIETQNTVIANEEHCKYIRNFFEKLIDIYLSLDEQDKIKIFGEKRKNVEV